jgi:hypothetical protein
MDLVPVNPTAQYPRTKPFRLEDVSRERIEREIAAHRPIHGTTDFNDPFECTARVIGYRPIRACWKMTWRTIRQQIKASYGPETLSFSKRYWAILLELFSEFGVDMASFRSSNDGEEIPEWTCLQVADALEARLDDFVTEDQPFIRQLILYFRNSGGFRQSLSE